MNEFGSTLGPDGVRLERMLPGPPDRVWSYLTDSRKRATWLAAGEFELRLGGRVELQFDNDGLSPAVPPPAKYENQECSFTGRLRGSSRRTFWPSLGAGLASRRK